MFMQNFGGQTKSIMVFLKVADSPLVGTFIHESNNEKHCHLRVFKCYSIYAIDTEDGKST